MKKLFLLYLAIFCSYPAIVTAQVSNDTSHYDFIKSNCHPPKSNDYTFLGCLSDNTALIGKQVDKQFLYGVIDNFGHVKLPIEYNYIEGMIRAADDVIIIGKYGKFSLLNLNGEIVTNNIYEKIYPFSEGLAAAKRNNYYYFLNSQGKEVITLPENTASFKFSEGLAVINYYPKGFGLTQPMTFGFIDKQGKTIIKPKYSYAEDFNHGKSLVYERNGTSYHIDKLGKLIEGTVEKPDTIEYSELSGDSMRIIN